MLASAPRDAFLLYAVAQELARTGDHAGAMDHYDRCLDADPAYCYAYFHKARTLESMGREAEAAATLRQGLAAARGAGDAQALREIQGYLDALDGGTSGPEPPEDVG